MFLEYFYIFLPSFDLISFEIWTYLVYIYTIYMPFDSLFYVSFALYTLYFILVYVDQQQTKIVSILIRLVFYFPMSV